MKDAFLPKMQPHIKNFSIIKTTSYWPVITQQTSCRQITRTWRTHNNEVYWPHKNKPHLNKNDKNRTAAVKHDRNETANKADWARQRRVRTGDHSMSDTTVNQLSVTYHLLQSTAT